MAVSKKASSSNNTNRNVLIAIILLLFLALIGMFISRRGSEIEIKSGDKSVKLTLAETEKKIADKIMDITAEKTLLERLLEEQKTNRKLQDSLTTLIYQRQNQLNHGTDLLNRFVIFKQLNGFEKDELLKEVSVFLDNGGGKIISAIDFGFKIKDEENQALKQENERLYAENQKLTIKLDNVTKAFTAQIDNLNNEIQKLIEKNNLTSKEKERLKDLYTIAGKTINDLEKQISDTSRFVNQVVDMGNRLRETGDKLKEQGVKIETYEDKIKKTRPVRIDNSVWKPINARIRKKNEEYKLKDIEEIVFEYTLANNYPTNKIFEELKFVFHIPKKNDPGHKVVIKKIDVTFNKNNKIIIKNGIEKDEKGERVFFGGGVYHVQVFHAATSEEKPIFFLNFTAT